MSPEAEQNMLLDTLLNSWDRSNTILLNLLATLPQIALDLRPMADSPSIAQLFTHIHYVRLVFVSEDVTEFAVEVPEVEWAPEQDPGRIAQMLKESSQVVRNAVTSKVAAGENMKLHFDHPILLLQHLIWHEGYHHGQIKLTLKLAGCPLVNQQAGPLTWGVWMRKNQPLS